MIQYPSIDRSTGQRFAEFDNAYLFDKLDGRNVRVEWNPKSGWNKWGTRHRLFDATDHEFAPAIPKFNAIYAEPLAKIAKDKRWERLTVFLELWQQDSLGGKFVQGQEYMLTLFDAFPHKVGQLGPKEYLKVFADTVPTAAFLGQCKWTRGVVDRVWANRLAGVTFEGVVAKAGSGNKLVMAKAKTEEWVKAVIGRYGDDEGKKITES